MERWNDRGAAIIPYGNSIILMRRERGYGKNKQIYYTIPGGGREDGERIDQTTIREMKEELGITIEVVELMYKLDTIKRMQYIFLGKYVSGKLGTGTGEEFQDVDYNKYGKYIPEVVTLEKLKRIKLVPTNLKREIIREFNYIIGKEENRINKKTRIDTGFSYNKFTDTGKFTNVSKENNKENSILETKKDSNKVNKNNKQNSQNNTNNNSNNFKIKQKLHLETYNKVIHLENELETKVTNIDILDKNEDREEKNTNKKKFVRKSSNGRVFSKKHQIINNYSNKKSVNAKKRRVNNKNESFNEKIDENTNTNQNSKSNFKKYNKHKNIVKKNTFNKVKKYNKVLNNIKEEKTEKLIDSKAVLNKKAIVNKRAKKVVFTKKLNKRSFNKNNK